MQTEHTPSVQPLKSESQGSPCASSGPAYFLSERILSSILLWNTRTSRPKQSREKSLTRDIIVQGKPYRIRLTIYAGGNLGLPSTVEQEFHVGFERLVTRIMERDGWLTNPIRVTGAEMLQASEKPRSGQSYAELTRYFRVMTLTGISTLKSGERERKREHVFHVFEQVIQEGETRPDGSLASVHEIYLAPWYLQSLNARNYLIRDHSLFRQLERPIAKSLHQLLHSLFDIGGGETTFRYSEIVQACDLTRFSTLSRIRQQLDPSYSELQTLGFLKEWHYTLIRDTNSIDYDIRCIAGPQWWNCHHQLEEDRLIEPPPPVTDPFLPDDLSTQLLMPLPLEAPLPHEATLHDILEFVGPRDKAYLPFWRQTARDLPRSVVAYCIGLVKEKIVAARNGQGKPINNRGSYLVTILQAEGKRRQVAWATKGNGG